MRAILITSLSAYWAAVSVHSAMAAAPAAGDPALGAAVLATGHATVAALFLWTAVAAWGGDRCDEVAGLALAVAALVLAGSVLAGEAAGAGAMQLAALAATYLVVKAEAAADEGPAAIDWSGEVARRLALGAAHGSMLGSLSRRGPMEGES